jgi:hypothetical protein
MFQIVLKNRLLMHSFDACDGLMHDLTAVPAIYFITY